LEPHLGDPGTPALGLRKTEGRYPLASPATAPCFTIRTVRTAPPRRKVFWG